VDAQLQETPEPAVPEPTVLALEAEVLEAAVPEVPDVAGRVPPGGHT
jgi:hypothetical protein